MSANPVQEKIVTDTKERIRRPRPVEALFYRPQQAAELIGVSRSTIYAMIADGKLPASKARGATLIHRDDLMSSITPKVAARS